MRKILFSDHCENREKEKEPLREWKMNINKTSKGYRYSQKQWRKCYWKRGLLRSH